MGESISAFVIFAHAREAMRRRGISEEIVALVVGSPEQRCPVYPGRHVFQRRMTFENARFLVRVFVDVRRLPPEVVTVYRTTKIEKYWKQDGS